MAIFALGLFLSLLVWQGGLTSRDLYGNSFHVLFVRHEPTALFLLLATWLPLRRYLLDDQFLPSWPSPVNALSFAKLHWLWVITLIVVLATWLGDYLVLHNFPLSNDEFMPHFQAQIFMAGEIKALMPLELREFGRALGPIFAIFDPQTGTWIESYLPIYSVLRTGFLALGVESLTGPVLGGMSLVLIAAVARPALAGGDPGALCGGRPPGFFHPVPDHLHDRLRLPGPPLLQPGLAVLLLPPQPSGVPGDPLDRFFCPGPPQSLCPCPVRGTLSPGPGLAEELAADPVLLVRCMSPACLVWEMLVDQAGLVSGLRNQRLPASRELPVGGPAHESRHALRLAISGTHGPGSSGYPLLEEADATFEVACLGVSIHLRLFFLLPLGSGIGLGIPFLLWSLGKPGPGGRGRLVLSQGKYRSQKSLGVFRTGHRSGGPGPVPASLPAGGELHPAFRRIGSIYPIPAVFFCSH